jgi:hypothetical protein
MAARNNLTVKQIHEMVRLKLNPDQQRIYDTINCNADKTFNVRWPRHDGARQVSWDKTTQTPIIKHITPQELYKEVE